MEQEGRCSLLKKEKHLRKGTEEQISKGEKCRTTKDYLKGIRS